jgi:SAM-dependent methyltransferase
MPLDGLRVLDLGCNAGYNIFDLIECGAREAVGIEMRDSYLAEAGREKERLGCTNATFRKADARFVDTLGLGRFDLCLCSGLLYHMQNPFNLLKRIRNVCRVLALETHIAPELWNFWRAALKYRGNLTLRKHRVVLDGHAFTGRYNIFPASQDMGKTSGSVVSHRTFWFDRASLEKAFDLAGFDVEAFYFGAIPPGKPPILVDHGTKRTKVFVLARVRQPDREIAVAPLD